MFNEDEELKEDLNADPFAHEILFIQELKLAPQYEGTSLGVQAIRTAASLLVTMGFVVADADIRLSLNDWKNLGFKRVPGEAGFHIWETGKKNPYSGK